MTPDQASFLVYAVQVMHGDLVFGASLLLFLVGFYVVVSWGRSL